MARRFGDQSRYYAKTHPWINFVFKMDDLAAVDFVHLGEAMSKSDHISHVPLPPTSADDLHKVYLAKGIHATTQIEGNTLSEDEVLKRIKGDLPLPESQEYLGKEVDNVLEGANLIIGELAAGALPPLTRARIQQFNKIIMQDLPADPGTMPGQIRRGSVVVGNVYRGAPAEDCSFLIDEMCEWLDSLVVGLSGEWLQAGKLVRAILAHLYLAWIHPFDDGNGRTARLVEFQLLADAGFPSPACHLLSNYYNRTRSRYYRVLRETSAQAPYRVDKFVSYGLLGFVEELREQLAKVSMIQLGMAWKSFIHEVDLGQTAATIHRRRELVMSLPAEATPISSLTDLNPSLARMYAGLTRKAVTRDLNALETARLIVRDGHSVRPFVERLLAFLPVRAPGT